MVNLTAPIFNDEDKAREHIEVSRWPDGVYCPHCGSLNVHRMAGKTQAGMFICNDCRDKFSVRTGSVMERSHIPLHKWLLALHVMAASKKGVSALQLQRMLGLGSYRTAWFMCHRIREAMLPDNPGPLGGDGKIIESDESVFGGKKKNRAHAKTEPKKQIVLTLVERDGESRSFHIANVTAKTLRETITSATDKESYLMTDEHPSYKSVGKKLSGHGTVNNELRSHHRWDSIVAAGVTHICTLRVVMYESERLRIETDLRQHLNPPCNRQ
jgi:transposase-like protein